MQKYFSKSAVLISLGILLFTTACAASTQTSAIQTSAPASAISTNTIPASAGPINKVVDPAFAYNLVQSYAESSYFMILDVNLNVCPKKCTPNIINRYPTVLKIYL